MTQIVLPILIALLIWWTTTGIVFYLVRMPAHTYRYSMAGVTLIVFAALYGLNITSAAVNAGNAYIAFACSVLIWSWQELGFLTGMVTGPRNSACPAGAAGWQRFWAAVQAIAYHELAIVVLAALVVAATWNGPNQVGCWTFVILWAMRESAKLNLFLGVPNLSEELLPPHLQYMASFFRNRPMNWLFPVSITAGTAATIALIQAIGGTADAGRSGATLLAALLGLAVLEHWFLVLPLNVGALWNLQGSHGASATAPVCADPSTAKSSASG